ncbi:MAG: DNA helicase RecQ [Clostridia bacterium]|nr:DNA helicase RecQ [Clostridia bacterium]
MDKHEILRRYFGYTEFRRGQAELIDAQLAGKDVFGIMPTGGGKSLCYQIPALLMDGITLVVSPLISLMKDQVAALKNAGIAAAYINSSLTYEQIQLVYKNMLVGKYKIIYIAPERLLTDGFLETVQYLRIAMVAVDEAHCISQWGQDFRPSYLKIVDFLKELEYRPIVSAFTATATQQVREDVQRILELAAPLCVVTGFDRPNLRFEVMRPKNKPAALLELVSERRGKSGIVYCATRKDVEKVCELLQRQGYAATRYHAGLPEVERHANQDDFVYDKYDIMVATNAFGMGIDKSNVAYVLHYNMPKSMEAYYQEAGRAGRDGEGAECILLYSAGDVQTAKFLIQHTSENEELSDKQRQAVIEQDMARLDKMIGYCKTDRCLRGYILDYFGEPHAVSCGNCANCETAVERDITTEAKMILSCVRRMHDYLGYSLGVTSVVRVLHGSSEKRIMQLGLNTLSTYGLMQNAARDWIGDMIECLEMQGYLHIDTAHGGVALTQRAGAILFHGETVKMRVHAKPQNKKKHTSDVPASTPDADLLFALKNLRLQFARAENVPAYIVFSNAALQDMAAKRPVTIEDFLSVSGVGKHKADRYGEAFVAEIKRYIVKQETDKDIG